MDEVSAVVSGGRPTVTGARRQLGERLKELREDHGLTQLRLSERITYSRTALAGAETGRDFPALAFWKACDAALAADGELVRSYKDIKSQEKSLRLDAASPAQSNDVGSSLTLAAIARTFTRVTQGGTPAEDSSPKAASLGNRVLGARRFSVDDACGFVTRPLLVLVGGYAGSGKSEFARFLSTVTGWAFLDKDTISRPLVESLLRCAGRCSADRESEVYLEQIRPQEYRSLMNSAFEQLSCGLSTVAAAPFLREFIDPSWLGRLNNRCEASGVELVVVWVSCDLESMHDYLRYRGASRDSWKLDNWADYSADVNVDFRPAAARYYVVDNNLNATVGIADQARALALRVNIDADA
ncbi:MAG: helix-turn-helix domain-containing protein [Pseudonocardia sp.]